MEVTNVQDRITHAIIGKKKVESFKIDESAEFFHVLSNALYSDKPKAVAREILCNAWDSHVESGIQDKPIVVTISNDKMSIQDFGAGIAPDMIQGIYGTYGRSTKVANDKVTGGFGLGSKAPFAYVDHFEVTSCHAGVKTIYQMSLSNAQVGGNPSISTIISVPTEETGITVSFNLKQIYDRTKFEELVRMIASMGEMNVMLNGEKITPVPFSKAEHNFVILKKDLLRESNITHFIRIRYGHVVYPIQSHEEYAKYYSSILKFLNYITTERGYYQDEKRNWVIVIQAPPNSLSVTPSRESLSMTDKTVASLKLLIEQAAKDLQSQRLTSIFEDLTEKAIKKTWMVDTPKVLFETSEKIPNIKQSLQMKGGDFLTNFEDIGSHYLSNKYPQRDGFRHNEIKLRVRALLEGGFPSRGLIQTYYRSLCNQDVDAWPSSKTDWFQKQVAQKLVKKILANNFLDYRRLLVCSGNGSYKQRGGSPYFTPILQFPMLRIGEYLPFLRNIVIIGYTRQIDRAHQFPIMKFWLGNPLESLFYHAPRSADKVKAAREFFHGLGMTVIDLTEAQSWETPEVVAPVTRFINPTPKPKKKGIPRLDNCLIANEVDTSGLFIETATRIDKPDFILTFSSKYNTAYKFEKLHLSKGQSSALVRLWGKQGGVVANATQEKKFMDLGSKGAKDWIIEKLLEEFKTNPKLETHYRNSTHHLDAFSYNSPQIIDICRVDPLLRKEAKLPPPLEQREQDIIELWLSFDDWQIRRTPQLKEIQDLIKSWDLTKETKAIIDLIKDNKRISYVCLDAIQAILGTTTGTKKEDINTARKIFVLALEG
jgi:phage pi2 protein 07